MTASDFAIVILAAGKGVRMRSALPKVLHRAGGLPLVEHVVRALRPLKPGKIVAVIGHEAAQVEAVLKPLGVRTVLQQPQLGTGHAMLIARRAIGSARFAVVLAGDAPLIRTETLEALIRTHRQSGSAATILSALVPNPAGYGRILRRQDNTVDAIVEDSALTDDQRAINEINSSMYALTLAQLWPCLARLRPNNKHRELYLTDTIAMLRGQGATVLAQIAGDADEVLGCNTRADLAAVDQVFRHRKCDALMASGVGMRMPGTIVIDSDVAVGADTFLEPGVQLLGRTRIGAGCTIQTGCVLSDVIVDDGVEIKPYSVMSQSYVGPAAQVGPFSHLRPGAKLLKGVHVGNFVEIKKSVLAEGVKANHLSYLGDAKIGSGTNVGAGTITCNYDGANKYPTTIGRRVFIGSDSALVAPVRIGDGAYIAAGSVITENVPPGALALARGRQVNKPGWVSARRRELSKDKKSARQRPARSKSAKSRRTARRTRKSRRS
jgi:bifunctional UDP-N-acetylglucosamine pyrophosphorylase/glucosamine-1-phosphate N-acetyltransferase